MSKEPNRNVYVGHRYVPLILEEWDKKISYEGLSVVTHKGNSYTSKKRVPVGIDILNKEFWSLTGNYNAQVEYYREETERVADDLLLKSDKTYVDSELGKKSDKTYVDTELGKKSNKTYVDTELGKKSDKTYVDTELGKKSDKTYVDTELDKKSDLETMNDISYVAPLNTFSNIADGINDMYQSLPDGAWLKIPAGEHVHDKPLILDREINVDFTGAFMHYDGDRTFPAVQIGKESDWTRRINIKGLISKRDTTDKYTIKDVGIRITNLAYSSVEFSAYNYNDGVVIDSGNSCGNVYNKYSPGWLYNNKRSIVMTTFNSTGWTNENNFYGGGFSFTSDTGSSEHCHITVEHKHGYRNNNNKFFGSSFEDAANEAYAIDSDGSSIYFYGCRFEYANRVKIGQNALDNVIMHGFGVDNLTVEGKTSALSTFGNRKVDLSLDSRGFKIRPKTSTGNAFSVEMGDSTIYSVSNTGDVKMRNLELLNRINFSNERGIGVSDDVSKTPYSPGSLFTNTGGGYNGFKFKTFGTAENTATGWKDVQLVHTALASQRPTSVSPGFMMFDTSRTKPIWWTGENWVDANGETV